MTKLIRVGMAILTKVHLMAIAAGPGVTSSHNGMIITKIPGMHPLIFEIPLLMAIGAEKSFVTFETIVFVLFGDRLVAVNPIKIMIVRFDLREILMTSDALESGCFWSR